MEQFIQAARSVGADVEVLSDPAEVTAYILDRVDGSVLVAGCASLERAGISTALAQSSLEVISSDLRQTGAMAVAGVTGANFGIAETGTVVLESTDENVRLATTLPDKHFVILDPEKILDTSDDAVPILRDFHSRLPQAYLAYITGPSRTADIERVLTIGVHGPAELHILLIKGLSDDVMER